MFPITITYWIWIPIEIVFYIIVGYLLKRNNELKTARTFLALTILGLIPLWAFIAPDSKDLPFDGLLYDTLMVVIKMGTLIILGDTKTKFKLYNWAGVALVITGLIIMQR